MIAHETRPIVSFDSIAEMGEFALNGNHRNHGDDMSSWTGGLTFQQAAEKCKTGDESLVPQAQALLDEFDLQIETVGRQRVPSICGMYPVVPEFLLGIPECMRAIREVEGESCPVRIVVGTTSSAGITSEQLLRRGVAILALVMGAARVRPVTLEFVAALSGCEMDNGEDYTIVRAHINSAPLDVATAAYALSSAGIQRHIGYGLCRALMRGKITAPNGQRYGKHGSDGEWQHILSADGSILRYPSSNRPQYMARMKELLDLTDDDLYVPEVFSTDESINEPVQWIRKQLSHLGVLAE